MCIGQADHSSTLMFQEHSLVARYSSSTCCMYDMLVFRLPFAQLHSCQMLLCSAHNQMFCTAKTNTCYEDCIIKQPPLAFGSAHHSIQCLQNAADLTDLLRSTHPLPRTHCHVTLA